MIYEERIDPYSGELFHPKRYNQRFANRKNQIAFNNTKAREIREVKKPIDTVLESNRKILLRLMENKKTSITKSKEFLLGSGFNFNYFNCSFTKDGKHYQCVYQFAIRKQGDGNFIIQKI